MIAPLKDDEDDEPEYAEDDEEEGEPNGVSAHVFLILHIMY